MKFNFIILTIRKKKLHNLNYKINDIFKIINNI